MMRPMHPRLLPRRRFMAGCAFVALPAIGARAATGTHRLTLVHTHTGERLALDCAGDGHYLPEALQALNHFLRDHYSGEIGTIDPALLDQLQTLQTRLGTDKPYEVISGFRGAATNERLRTTRGGGVASRSLHLEGRAVDVRLPGVALESLRDAALDLRSGGVGFYPRERFVHLDTGRMRRW
jgi:uncharacterized protein YcbK (DUF882 family)